MEQELIEARARYEPIYLALGYASLSIASFYRACAAYRAPRENHADQSFIGFESGNPMPQIERLLPIATDAALGCIFASLAVTQSGQKLKNL